MNMVGWIGGGFGPLVIGWAATHGSNTNKIENMSEAISLGGLVYLGGATALVVTILFFVDRDISARTESIT
jgi:hypothetical protein